MLAERPVASTWRLSATDSASSLSTHLDSVVDVRAGERVALRHNLALAVLSSIHLVLDTLGYVDSEGVGGVRPSPQDHRVVEWITCQVSEPTVLGQLRLTRSNAVGVVELAGIDVLGVGPLGDADSVARELRGVLDRLAIGTSDLLLSFSELVVSLLVRGKVSLVHRPSVDTQRRVRDVWRAVHQVVLQ